MDKITRIEQPANYYKIDKHLSRSAQMTKNNILWLKEDGVTDIINFRTMHSPNIDFNEQQFVEQNGLKYHKYCGRSKKQKR